MKELRQSYATRQPSSEVFKKLSMNSKESRPEGMVKTFHCPSVVDVNIDSSFGKNTP